MHYAVCSHHRLYHIAYAVHCLLVISYYLLLFGIRQIISIHICSYEPQKHFLHQFCFEITSFPEQFQNKEINYFHILRS